MEPLEDRCVPSATPTLDLTTQGAIGSINGAIFRQLDQQPSGSGVIDSFVRVKASGNSTVAHGYNTDARPLQFDENKSPVFTHSLQLSSVPSVTIDGVKFREFMLDINQASSSPLLSLDELRLFGGNSGSLNNYHTDTNTLTGATLVYDMGGNSTGTGNWVELNARLSHGSGSSDILLYVPDAEFAGQSYVYLYSTFGVNVGSNGGYEEWAVATHAIPISTQTYTITATVIDFVPNSFYTVTLTDTTLGITVSYSGSTSSTPTTFSFGDLTAGNDYTVSITTSSGTTATPTSYTFTDLMSNQTALFTITGGKPPPNPT